jgi:hypothetical protein
MTHVINIISETSKVNPEVFRQMPQDMKRAYLVAFVGWIRQAVRKE